MLVHDVALVPLEISVSFEGVIDYAGDYCDILGNGEVWEFNIMNNRCIGRRWSA